MWLEEREESFPLNSRKHMGADGARRPNLPTLAQVELKGAQKGLEFLPPPREGELETRRQQHTGQKMGPEGSEQESMTRTPKVPHISHSKSPFTEHWPHPWDLDGLI